MYDITGYTEAQTVLEASQYLLAHEDAKIIAGGTDVLIKSRAREEKFIGQKLVGITRIPSLKEIYLDQEGNIHIGPCNSFTAIENHPLIKTHLPSLGIAAGTVGGPQIRNMGTIGGNICNGATSADTASTLVAFNAQLEIQNGTRTRTVPISAFYLGPGKVSLAQGDVLTAILIKKEDYHQYKGYYIKFSQRKAMDIATIGCSVLLKENDHIIEDLRIAYGVAAPTPVRAHQAEAMAKGLALTEENINKIGKACLLDTKARDSWRASKAFREGLIQELPQKAIKMCLRGDTI